jgi:hypothetical protein
LPDKPALPPQSRKKPRAIIPREDDGTQHTRKLSPGGFALR